MKKIIFFIMLVLCSGSISAASTDRPFTPLNAPILIQPTTSDFTFCVFGDFRTSRRDRPYPVTLRQMLNEIDIIAPSFVISTGDAYYGYGGSFQRFKNEVDNFLSTTKSLDVPFLNIIGNHEMADAPKREAYIKEKFGNFYGSFDFSNSHFIMLDTEEMNKEGAISGEQLRWLEKDIEANRNAENIFVFMHRPLFPVLDPELVTGKSFKDKENRDYLHTLFKQYKVKAVFTGHEHLFNDTFKDGIRYIITGGGGAPFYQSPSKGGFLHYLIVKVKGKDISIDVIEPYNLQIRHISGNDGFEQKAEVEVSNISNTDLYIRNLLLKMPRANADRYKVRAVSISPRGHIGDHMAKIRQIKDNRDGTATVSVETHLPQNSLIRVTVEVDI